MARIFDVGIDFSIDDEMQYASSADSVFVCQSCAFNMPLRADLRGARDGGDHTSWIAPQRCHDPLQRRREGFAGDPGVAPAQEAPYQLPYTDIGYEQTRKLRRR
jgi:hypothetical protein